MYLKKSWFLTSSVIKKQSSVSLKIFEVIFLILLIFNKSQNLHCFIRKIFRNTVFVYWFCSPTVRRAKITRVYGDFDNKTETSADYSAILYVRLIVHNWPVPCVPGRVLVTVTAMACNCSFLQLVLQVMGQETSAMHHRYLYNSNIRYTIRFIVYIFLYRSFTYIHIYFSLYFISFIFYTFILIVR